MKTPELDLHQLRIFQALMRSRSVSTAAGRLELSQSSLSHALARMRAIYNDPLFVRLAGVMEPTPLALQLAAGIDAILDIYERDLSQRRAFDPSNSTRAFSFGVSELGAITFVPRIVGHFRKVAPGCTVVSVDRPPTQAFQALAFGEIDVAMGYFDKVERSLMQQRLFTDACVTIARRGHPAFRRALDAKLFAALPHLQVQALASLDRHIDRVLERQKLRRNVVAVTQSSAIPEIIANTDCICTVGARVAESVRHWVDIEVHPCPIPMPEIALRQLWHRRYSADPANRWLRRQMLKIFRVT